MQPMVLTLSRTKWETVLGFNIYTNHVIEARGPDIVLVKKVTKECVMLSFLHQEILHVRVVKTEK